ncbi:hypothetical protein DOTSEDRAFT_69726 [Dothistroma septosporum NZE10]|uniref:Peptidase S9 prolyl oligopeptidase catalytic domain-containing protein n=1 Tax=Dothistroma septosporum (strain NZE10 / CBS 128990) TaxID=675120 RepID=N1PWU8_DOTSN|nr:hypothetical protein DOTSEDRAFT_69726 [Dothistroma septosporum NZE10]
MWPASIWALTSLAHQQASIMRAPAEDSASPVFSFSPTWSVLGPWQIGTREASWGSDPLERLGGFRALEYCSSATYRTSLAINGTIGWTNLTAKLSTSSSDPRFGHASAALTVAFHQVEWQDLTNIYGWAALQWQAWARGEIIVTSDKTEVVTLYTPQVLEYWIDDVHYFGGDFFSYQRAAVTLRLTPGSHRMNLRIIRDVRAMGGVGEPTVALQLDLKASTDGLQLVQSTGPSVLMSDFVGDEHSALLASPFASVTVRNDADEEITISSVQASQTICTAILLAEVRLLPGQTRPVSFKVECVSPTVGVPFLHFDLDYHTSSDKHKQVLSVAAGIRIVNIRDPQKITYMHPGGIVSYAILRPPSENATGSARQSELYPMLLNLHGAGVEADSDVTRHSLNGVADLKAWVLFPTGVTPWSGDDWHAWGFQDVEAAVAAISDWIPNVKWKGPGVDQDKWLASGHSNGGQGTWYTLLHRPDKVFAAAPISGYSSIQNYVPYTLWQVADPGRTAVLQASLSSYRHEMLLSNAKDISVLQQHGGADDNVPPYNSRFMAHLIRQAGADSTYVEMPGQPHYWDGVLTTRALRDFYEQQIALVAEKRSGTPLDLRDFTLTVANPGDTGSKNGVEILQLAVPGRYGSIDVVFDPLTKACILATTGVRMFSLPPYFRDCSSVILDGQNLEIKSQNFPQGTTLALENGTWHLDTSISNILPAPPRRERQLGAMDAILRTEGAFSIVRHTNSSVASHLALQVSRNLCQYFAADAAITDEYKTALEHTGNVISIVVGDDLPPSCHVGHPIEVSSEGIYVRDGPRYPVVAGRGLAAIFLRPLPLGRLELVVWGSDDASLPLAARLVPMMAGVGQPDFVIADNTMLWNGLEGALALGFFDGNWEVSRNSFLS